MKCKLFVVTHKEVDNIPSDRVCIGVGTNNNLKCASVFDSSGKNISDKNKNYCELTALYWIWKNDDSQYVGLEHYRRFFCSKNLLKAKPLSRNRIEKLLQKYEVIIPRKSRTKPTVYDFYANSHCKRDLDICAEIINRDFPEYSEACAKVFNSNKSSMFNMFVMSKNLMDEYCEWLFKLLFLAEKEVDLSDKDDYQKRVFGFLSERLFNVWLNYKNLKCYYSWVYNINDSPLLLKSKRLCYRVKRLFKK